MDAAIASGHGIPYPGDVGWRQIRSRHRHCRVVDQSDRFCLDIAKSRRALDSGLGSGLRSLAGVEWRPMGDYYPFRGTPNGFDFAVRVCRYMDIKSDARSQAITTMKLPSITMAFSASASGGNRGICQPGRDNWTHYALAAGINSIASDGYVFLCTDQSNYYVSADGATWTTQAMPFTGTTWREFVGMVPYSWLSQTISGPRRLPIFCWKRTVPAR